MIKKFKWTLLVFTLFVLLFGYLYYSEEKNILKSSLEAFSGLDLLTAEISSRKETFVDLSDIERRESVHSPKKEKVEETVKDALKREKDEEEKTDKIKGETDEVDLNSAIGEELEKLSGIGPVYAERIIDSRPFCSLDDLLEVEGIGKKTLQNIKKEGFAFVKKYAGCSDRENDKKGEKILSSLKKIKERTEILGERIEEEDEKEKIEINSATAEELKNLDGIGPVYAKRIIENRPFCFFGDLIEIKGVGEKTLERIKKQDIAYLDPPSSCVDKEESEKDEDKEERLKDEIQTLRTRLSDARKDVGEKRREVSAKRETISKIKAQRDKCRLEEQVNINRATKEELTSVKGIGAATAESIMVFLEESPIFYLEEIEEISGIGEKTVESIIDKGFCTWDEKEEEEEKTPPEIAPGKASYNLSEPSDVITTVNWNSAVKVKEVICNEDVVESGKYKLDGDKLTIYRSFFKEKDIESGDELELEVNFDFKEVVLTVKITDITYENILLNSDFKTRGDGYQSKGDDYDADGWNQCPTAESTYRSDEKAKSGSWSMKQKRFTSSYSREFASDPVEVVSEEDYVFGGWYYLVEAEEEVAEKYTYFMEINWLDKNKELVERYPSSGSSFQVFEDWTQTEFKSKSPKEAKYASLKTRVRRDNSDYSATDVYWDDLYIYGPKEKSD